MMESTDSNNEVKTWLLARKGSMIDVMIVQKILGESPQQVVWKGQGKVVRCVREGVVLDLNAGGAFWWNRLWRKVGVKHVVPRWIQKPISIPYCDLAVDQDPTTGVEWLVIDAATWKWKRSPEELKKRKA
jgi:hypothetical protein